jgi:hypothetical protein
MDKKPKTHADLLPKGLCPAFLWKHLLTHSINDPVYDDRKWPGDGYYWCAKTCTCIGPDDQHVHPSACLQSRSCYDGQKIPEA